MDLTEQEFEQANALTNDLRQAGYAVSARYDRRAKRVIVSMSNNIEIAFPARQAEGLAGASDEALSEIEITPAGLGLHWPALDADVYVPDLLKGIFGSKSWMAAQLGAIGGKSTSAAKSAASRANGKKGGRPRTAAG